MPTVNYNILFTSNVADVFAPINQTVDQATVGIQGLTQNIETCLEQVHSFDQAASVVDNFSTSLVNVETPALSLNTDLSDLTESIGDMETTIGDVGVNIDNLTSSVDQFSVSTIEPITQSETLAETIDEVTEAVNGCTAQLPNMQEQLGETAAAAGDASEALEDANETIDETGTAGANSSIGLNSFLGMIKSLSNFLPDAIRKQVQYGITLVKMGVPILTAVKNVLFHKRAVDADTTSVARNNRTLSLSGIASTIYAGAMGVVAVATRIATGAVRALSTAIYSIPIVGWILAGITALIALVKILWEKSRGFREFLFGTWGALKAIFHNIGVVVKNVWDVFMKPFFAGVVIAFNAIKEAFISAWTGIRDFFVGMWEAITGALATAWETITGFFGNIWDWLKNTFGGVSGFIGEWIIDPIKNAFAGLWDFIKRIFDRIIGMLKAVFRPIVNLWKRIFSGDFENVSEAYIQGAIEGGESFDSDQKLKNGEVIEGSEGEFELPKVETTPGKPSKKTDLPGFKYTPARNTGDSSVGGGAARNITININKLVESITLSVTNLKEGKEQIKKAVAEALVTAVNDVNLAI